MRARLAWVPDSSLLLTPTAHGTASAAASVALATGHAGASPSLASPSRFSCPEFGDNTAFTSTTSDGASFENIIPKSSTMACPARESHGSGHSLR